MTDKQIVKALEEELKTALTINHRFEESNDTENPDDHKFIALLINTIKLINRQKAEIERLQSESIGKCELAISMRNDNNLDSNCNYCIDKSTAEAVKEFADLSIKRICENVTPIPQQKYLVNMCIQEIKKTQKEVVGDNNE